MKADPNEYVSNLWLIARLLRLQYWSKNLLVFVPAFTAYDLFASSNLKSLIATFFSFSVVASAVYILNDIWDYKDDEQLPEKRIRPFVAGEVSLSWSLFLLLTLLTIGLVVAYSTSVQLGLLLTCYFLATQVYAGLIKKLLFIDVIMLSLLLYLRIYSGAIVLGSPFSIGLFLFSGFIFLNLALLKRYAELKTLPASLDRLPGRAYQRRHESTIHTLGIVSGFLAIFILLLFATPFAPSDASYPSTGRLITLMFIFTFWLRHLWRAASQSQIYCDPVAYVLRDHFSYLALLSIIAFFWWLA